MTALKFRGAGDGLTHEMSLHPRCTPTMSSLSKSSRAPNLDLLYFFLLRHPIPSSPRSSIWFSLPIYHCLKCSFCSCHHLHSSPVTSQLDEQSACQRALTSSPLPGLYTCAGSPFWHYLPLPWRPQWLLSLQDEKKLAACRVMDFICSSQYFRELLTKLKKIGIVSH